jgi:Fe-Mn family superoxide dismutase
LCAIEVAFGTFEEFKASSAKLELTNLAQDGHGFVFIRRKKVEVSVELKSRQSINARYGCGGTPILGMDVWEHAYYLHYQNRRPDYIEAFSM